METYLCCHRLSHDKENVTGSWRSKMQPTQTLSNWFTYFIKWSRSVSNSITLSKFLFTAIGCLGRKKAFWKAWYSRLSRVKKKKEKKYESFVQYSEEGWYLAVYQPSPAALSWLISLSVSLGHLLITNQKASLTSHKRRRTGADS